MKKVVLACIFICILATLSNLSRSQVTPDKRDTHIICPYHCGGNMICDTATNMCVSCKAYCHTKISAECEVKCPDFVIPHQYEKPRKTTVIPTVSKPVIKPTLKHSHETSKILIIFVIIFMFSTSVVMISLLVIAWCVWKRPVQSQKNIYKEVPAHEHFNDNISDVQYGQCRWIRVKLPSIIAYDSTENSSKLSRAYSLPIIVHQNEANEITRRNLTVYHTRSVTESPDMKCDSFSNQGSRDIIDYAPHLPSPASCQSLNGGTSSISENTSQEKYITNLSEMHCSLSQLAQEHGLDDETKLENQHKLSTGYLSAIGISHPYKSGITHATEHAECTSTRIDYIVNNQEPKCSVDGHEVSMHGTQKRDLTENTDTSDHFNNRNLRSNSTILLRSTKLDNAIEPMVFDAENACVSVSTEATSILRTAPEMNAMSQNANSANLNICDTCRGQEISQPVDGRHYDGIDSLNSGSLSFNINLDSSMGREDRRIVCQPSDAVEGTNDEPEGNLYRNDVISIEDRHSLPAQDNRNHSNVSYIPRSITDDSAMASVYDPAFTNRDGFHLAHVDNNPIYEQLQGIPWVMGYHSEGRSISVYGDLDIHDPEELQQQLVDVTGQPANKFKLRQNAPL